MWTRFTRKCKRMPDIMCGIIFILIVPATFYLMSVPTNRTGEQHRTFELNIPPYLKKYFKSSSTNVEKQLDDGVIKLSASEIGESVKNEELSFTSNPVKHIAYLKVHKTGSSSVQNIFLRYGDSQNLTFILASQEHNECPGKYNNDHCISFDNTLHDCNIVPPPKHKSYDILVSHVIYNSLAFRKYLPADAKYIGIVREPVRRLESALGYFGLFRNVTLSKYISNVEQYNHPMTNNRMAFEYGFKTEWFPNATHVTLSETEKVMVNEYVSLLMNDFDLILVNERLDESLVMMRRLLGWTIIYQRVMVRPHKSFTPKDLEHVQKYLYLDYILYDRAVKTLNMKITEASSDFYDEVNIFKMFNTKVAAFCECKDCGPDAAMTMPATYWSRSFQVNRAFCDALAMPEPLNILMLRYRQYGNYQMEDETKNVYINRRKQQFWVS